MASRSTVLAFVVPPQPSPPSPYLLEVSVFPGRQRSSTKPISAAAGLVLQNVG